MTWGPFSRISPSSPGPGPAAVEAHHDELDARGGTALGVGQLLVGVVVVAMTTMGASVSP